MMFSFFPSHIHIAGIGGIGTSALARIFVAEGKHITGSDAVRSSLTDELVEEGISISIGDEASNECRNAEMLIYSAALSDDHAELRLARKKNIPFLTYFEALGKLTTRYSTVSICGTHGKTTTTAMTALAFIECGLDPTVIVGSKLDEFGGKNARLGKSRYFVLESCEYKRSFLSLNPEIIVLTNLELDHPDYYRDFDDYKSAFQSFIMKLSDNGIIVYNADDADLVELSSFFSGKKIRYGKNLSSDFRLIDQDTFIFENEKHSLELSILGDHNRMNALAALSCLYAVNGNLKRGLEALKKYHGAWRRFELKGEFSGAKIFDDYGHHPTEVRATLLGAREQFPHQKITLVFQPHQYSRTKKLFNDFMTAFADADEVIIPNIYRARDSDEDVQAVSPESFAMALSNHHPRAHCINGIENTAKYLRNSLQKGEILIIMGAGDVTRLSDILLKSV